MSDVFYDPSQLSRDLISASEDNIKPDRSDLDLLYSCVLDWGLPLSKPYRTETIEGATVHFYDDKALLACFDKDLSEEATIALANLHPLRAVFRDSCFKDGQAKVNLMAIFKQFSPDTKVKTL